jgi:hypothetical protein
MALSDCPKCWETPCVCGYDYRMYDMDRLIKMRDMFQKLIDDRQRENPTDLSKIIGKWPGEPDDGFEKFVNEIRTVGAPQKK